MLFYPIRPEVQSVITDNKGLFFDPYYLCGNKTIECSITEARVLQIWKNSFNAEEFYSNMYEQMPDYSGHSFEDYNNLFSSLFLLQDPNYTLKLQEKQYKFVQSTELHLSSTGNSFPAEPPLARLFCESLLLHSTSVEQDYEPNPICIAMPHIDFRLTTKPYQHVLSLLKSCNPKIVLLIGISHYPNENTFFTTGKNITTPFGVIENDSTIAEKIRQATGISKEVSEWMFRAEYSLDYPLYFIKYILPEARVVPVLVSSFDRYLTNGKNIDQWSKIQQTLDVLKEIYSEQKNDMLIIVSGDGAHRGKAFGDSLPAVEFQSSQSSFDEQYSNCIVEGSYNKLWKLLALSGNQEKICGFAPHYAALYLLEDEKPIGKQVYHDYILPSYQDSLLSFGVWALYRS